MDRACSLNDERLGEKLLALQKQIFEIGLHLFV